MGRNWGRTSTDMCCELWHTALPHQYMLCTYTARRRRRWTSTVLLNFVSVVGCLACCLPKKKLERPKVNKHFQAQQTNETRTQTKQNAGVNEICYQHIGFGFVGLTFLIVYELKQTICNSANKLRGRRQFLLLLCLDFSLCVVMSFEDGCCLFNKTCAWWQPPHMAHMADERVSSISHLCCSFLFGRIAGWRLEFDFQLVVCASYIALGMRLWPSSDVIVVVSI